MNLKPSAFLGRVVGRAAQGDNHIESILPAARAALAAIGASMVDEKDSNALAPEPKQPVLHR